MFKECLKYNIVLSIKQKELVTKTGKSLSIVKRIMEFLQKKEYIRRVDGKRYGKWGVLYKECRERDYSSGKRKVPGYECSDQYPGRREKNIMSITARDKLRVKNI